MDVVPAPHVYSLEPRLRQYETVATISVSRFRLAPRRIRMSVWLRDACLGDGYAIGIAERNDGTGLDC
jgi:hypothetical protein